MSDLLGGGLPPGASRSNARGQATTGSPSGIKGPRDIMRERNAREARRKAEQEELERNRAEKETQLIEEEKNRTAQRRAAAAGAVAAPLPSLLRGAAEQGAPRVTESSQRAERRSERVATVGETAIRPPDPSRGSGGRADATGEASGPIRRRPQSQQTPQTSQPIPPGASARPQRNTTQPEPSTPPQVGPSTAAQPAQGVQGDHTSAAPSQTRSSFPHAFERWETLSSHWEGLTSFWIRRLEDNTNDINRDPLSAQLARQVTDLSAAGANLFHAVVELQRLRASSERKFQRWFFDTKAEQERAGEIQALTERALNEERMSRHQMIDQAVRAALAEKEREDAHQRGHEEKIYSEMKRELEISKLEARRAWEELGRRETDERSRTASLRDGQPTLVGGVQVVPMMQGVPSRHGSGRQPTTVGGQAPAVEYEQVGGQDPNLNKAYGQSSKDHPQDPFVDIVRPHTSGKEPTQDTPSTQAKSDSPHTPSRAPAVQPTTASEFYKQHEGTMLHPVGQARTSGEGTVYSEEEYEIDEQGQFRLDSRGNKIRYHASDDDSDEEDSAAAAKEQELAYIQKYNQPTSGVEYGSGLTSTTAHLAPTNHPALSIAEDPDYEGEGYGSGPGWEGFPRHQHPTRLSDVLEEDEHSRTSTSQPSGRL